MSLVGKPPSQLTLTIDVDTTRFAAALSGSAWAAREAEAVRRARRQLRDVARACHFDPVTAEDRAKGLAVTTALGTVAALDAVRHELIYRWLQRTAWSRSRRHRSRVVTRSKQRRRW